MFRVLATLRAKKRLLKEFVVRDLKARYVGSSMGFFWSVVFPILNLFVYMFVFRLVLNARWADTQGSSEVALVMLGGIVVWVAFAETVSRSTNTLVENANLIQKVVFPSEVLTPYLSISSIVNMCIGLPVVLAGVAYFAYFSDPIGHLRSPGPWGAYQRMGHYPIAENLDAFDVRFTVIGATQKGDIVFPFTVSGTAVEGEDYTLSQQSPMVIPREGIDGRLHIDLLRDDVVDDGETIVITLGEPTNATLPPEDEGPRELVYRIHDVPASEKTVPYKADAPLVIGWGKDNYQPMKLGLPLVALPLLLLLQIVFSTGLGYFLATLNLFLRDVYHLIGVGLTVWMFATPIFYPGFLVEKAGYGWMLDINPMHWLITGYRRVLIFGEWPDWALLGRFALASVLVFAIGSTFFSRQKKQFPDLL